MKRLVLIGVAACAVAAMSTLPASAMPRVVADTLVAGSDSPLMLVRGGHGMATVTWGLAAAVITMTGAEATIAVGTNGLAIQHPRPSLVGGGVGDLADWR
jgi:hypothetical protein